VTTGLSRPSRKLRLLGLVIVLAALPAGGAAFGADDELGGYEAAATGHVFRVAPSVPSLFPYLDQPVEGTLSLATATLASGGVAFGRASTVWPGTVLAGLGPLISTASGQPVPIPAYPVVVESREYDGAKHSDTPGMTMATDASPDGSSAKADVGGLILPGLIDFGSSRTTSLTTLADAVVTATSTAAIKDLNLAAGAVKIGSIVSTSTAASDAKQGTCKGTLAIEGLEVGGVPASVDNEGVHANGEAVVPGQDPNAQIASTLAATGITLRTIGGIGTCEGTAASQSTGGLVVQLPTPAAGSVPPGALVMVLASTSASADAALGSTGATDDFVPGDTGIVDRGTPVLGDVLDRAPGPVVGGAGLSAVGGTGRASGGNATAQVEGVTVANYDWDGLPTSLVVGLLAAAVFLATRVRRYMQRLMSLSPVAKEPLP
jgi:hypothetical protein